MLLKRGLLARGIEEGPLAHGIEEWPLAHGIEGAQVLYSPAKSDLLLSTLNTFLGE
jgi:hypothetical protein